MRKSTVGIIFAVAIVLSFAQPIFANVLAVWDFGDSSAYYTLAPDYYYTASAPTLVVGGGTLDIDGKNGVAYTDSAGISHIAGQAVAWDDIKVSGVTNAYFIVTIDTTGYSSLTFHWDCKSELATCFDLAYRTSTDGEWIQILDNYAVITTGWDAGTWNSITIDLSAITALNNQSYVQLRIDDLVEGPGNKKFAFDNVEITGVPEPTTLLLLGLGAMLLKKSN